MGLALGSGKVLPLSCRGGGWLSGDPPPPKEHSPLPPGSLEGGALPEAPGESEPVCPRQDHTQTARPQVSSCTWGWGEASSPALALLYPPLFSVLRTHRAAGQPQQTLRRSPNKDLRAACNATRHPSSSCTCTDSGLQSPSPCRDIICSPGFRHHLSPLG